MDELRPYSSLKRAIATADKNRWHDPESWECFLTDHRISVGDESNAYRYYPPYDHRRYLLLRVRGLSHKDAWVFLEKIDGVRCSLKAVGRRVNDAMVVRIMRKAIQKQLRYYESRMSNDHGMVNRRARRLFEVDLVEDWSTNFEPVNW